MSPANIEAKLKAASPLIAHAVAIGDRRPYNVALIVLDPDGAAFAAARPRRRPRDRERSAAEDRGRGRARQTRSSRESSRSRSSRSLAGEWEPGGDELTPDDEAQAQADRAKVRRRDRLALRRLRPAASLRR